MCAADVHVQRVNSKRGGGDAYLVVGADLRMEALLLNTWMHKAYLNGIDGTLIGCDALFNYDHTHLGGNLAVFVNILEDCSPYMQVLERAQQPLVIVSMSPLLHLRCWSRSSWMESLLLVGDTKHKEQTRARCQLEELIERYDCSLLWLTTISEVGAFAD